MADFINLPQETTNTQLQLQGLQSGLQALLGAKMQGMQQQQMARGLQALGVPGQLAMLPPELLQHIVPQYMKTQAEMPISNLRQQIVSGQGGMQGTPETSQGAPSMGAYDENGNITVPEINRRRQLINQLSQMPGGYKAAEAEEKTLNDLIKNRQEFMKGEKELGLKERELGIKHAEHALTSAQKKEEFTSKQEEAKQRRIDSGNKKPLEVLQAKENTATNLDQDLNDILTDLDDPEVETGQMMRFRPEATMNQPTLDLYKKLQKIVNSLGSGEVRGVLSKARIDLLNASKPSIYQSPEYIRKWINDFKRDWKPWIRKGQIRDRLITENNGKQPENIMTLINKKYHEEEPIYTILDEFSPEQIQEGSEFIEPKSKAKLRRDSSSPLGFVILSHGSK